MLIAFGSQSYQHSSLPVSAQEMVNGYLEATPPNAKSPAAVVSSFGIKDFTYLEAGKMRGGLVVNDQMFVVCGTGLYQILPNTGAIYYLGQVPGVNPVFMDGDGLTVMVTADGPSYLWDGTPGTLIVRPKLAPPVATDTFYLETEDGFDLLAEDGTKLRS